MVWGESSMQGKSLKTRCYIGVFSLTSCRRKSYDPHLYPFSLPSQKSSSFSSRRILCGLYAREHPCIPRRVIRDMIISLESPYQSIKFAWAHTCSLWAVIQSYLSMGKHGIIFRAIFTEVCPLNTTYRTPTYK